jgi:hypothetical protein
MLWAKRAMRDSAQLLLDPFKRNRTVESALSGAVLHGPKELTLRRSAPFAPLNSVLYRAAVQALAPPIAAASVAVLARLAREIVC